MRVLVAYAGKHGATAEVAAAIAEQLELHGHRAEALSASEVEALDGFDAFVIGSAVYYGRWLDPATELCARAAGHGPRWLFSVGMTANVRLPDAAQGLEHRLILGRLERARLTLRERLVIRAVRAAVGDLRNWDAIRAYGSEVAVALDKRSSPQGAISARGR